MAGLFFSPSSILMACNHPTAAVVAILCTSLLPMQGQVTIPRNLPLMQGVDQEAIFKQPAMRKDFRAVDFEVGILDVPHMGKKVIVWVEAHARDTQLPVADIVTHKVPYTDGPGIYDMLISNPDASGAILLDWDT